MLGIVFGLGIMATPLIAVAAILYLLMKRPEVALPDAHGGAK